MVIWNILNLLMHDETYSQSSSFYPRLAEETAFRENSKHIVFIIYSGMQKAQIEQHV